MVVTMKARSLLVRFSQPVRWSAGSVVDPAITNEPHLCGTWATPRWGCRANLSELTGVQLDMRACHLIYNSSLPNPGNRKLWWCPADDLNKGFAFGVVALLPSQPTRHDRN